MRDVRGRSQRTRPGAVGGLLLLLVTFTGSAAAGEDVVRRCENRLEPRSLFGRNYVLDHVRTCRRVEHAPPVVPVRRDRPAPPTVFGEPVEAARQRVSWDASRTLLGNAQYERSVRAGRRAFSGRMRRPGARRT